jgi:hypothetical protein
VPVLLTVDEAAELLRTTRRGIYAMIARQQLPGVITSADACSCAPTTCYTGWTRSARHRRGVNGDERHNPTVSERRLGSRHSTRPPRPLRTSTTPEGPDGGEKRRAAMGRSAGT